MNFYTVKDTENFAIIDSPGDTEIEESLKKFASKGYLYTKMLIYMMSEEKKLDDDSLGKNEYLEILLETKVKYKIPLLIFLTHSDDYCDNIKKRNNKDWKKICKDHLDENKKELLSHLQRLIDNNFKGNCKMNENDIMHIVLLEPVKRSDEEIIGELDEVLKEEYDNGDEEEKKKILSDYRKYAEAKEFIVCNFLKKNMKVLYPKELIKKIKENIPSQYHSALNNVD